MRNSSLFWGAILLTGGILLLFDNLGYLPVSAWYLIWPMILIAIGIWLIWSYYSSSSMKVEHAEILLENATRGLVKIQHAAGRISLSSTEQSEILLTGDFKGGVVKKVIRSDEFVEIKLSMPSNDFFVNWSPGYTLDWKVGLNPNIPLTLNLETGAGDLQLDLSNLKISEFGYKSGASSTKITMPSKAGFTLAHLETGASTTIIQIPEGVAAKIKAQGGLSAINIDKTRFPRQDKFYISPGYDTAENKLELLVDIGVGAIEVK